MWVETASLSFTARHEASQSDVVLALLEDLESFRERLEQRFPRTPANVSLVLHDSTLQLALSQPYLPLARRLSAPEARRYMVGWFASNEVHTLAPHTLKRLAAGEDSLRALMLSPHRAYALLAIGMSSPSLPPPFRPRTLSTLLRLSWLAEGASQFFSGQLPYMRTALARRLKRRLPSLPPDFRDAWLLGGSIFDLLALERGEEACVDLASRAGGGRALLEAAFGQSLTDIRMRWHSHLEHIARPVGAANAGRPPATRR
jgi:hypothetical protein